VKPSLPWSPKIAFAACLAYANLCFLNAWQQIEGRYFDYFLKSPLKLDAGLRYFSALLADILLLALVLWAIHEWIRRAAGRHAVRIVAIGFLALLIVPLNLLRTQLGLFSLGNPWALAGLAVVGAASLYWHMALIRPLGFLLVISWPLLIIKIVPTVAHFVSASSYAEPPLARRLATTPARRLVWVVFDEFDKRLAFDDRPADVHLPNLDALQAQSLSATGAYRGARDTLVAIPTLILGHVASHADVAGPTGLSLKFADGTRQSYPFHGDIFSIVRSWGINAAVSGWYHPYCRLFHESLTDCVWAPAESSLESIFVSLDPPVIGGFFETMAMFPAKVLARFPGMDRIGLRYSSIGYAPVPARAAHQIGEYRTIRDAALRFSTDTGLGFVYLHFPVPHHFGIYDARTRRMKPGGNYFDNLQLADTALGDLRSAMERAGVWDSATVLVSSDHSLRYMEASAPNPGDTNSAQFLPPGAEQPLVPFLLKMPGEHSAVRYEPAFNAVLTRDLVLSILAGEVSTPDQAAQWLDRNRARLPVGP
jgi:hypothetical protein